MILGCVEVDMTWPNGAREEWWGPRNGPGYCFLSSDSNFPYLLPKSVRSSWGLFLLAQSRPWGLPWRPSLPSSLMGFPKISLQLIWFPTLLALAASSLWAISPFLPASIVRHILHPSTPPVETFAFCSCPREQGASRQLGAGLLSLTSKDAPPLSSGMATRTLIWEWLVKSSSHCLRQTWSSQHTDFWLNPQSLYQASCVGWKGGQGKHLLCSFLPLINSPVWQCQALIFFLLTHGDFLLSCSYFQGNNDITVGEQGEDQKPMSLTLA